MKTAIPALACILFLVGLWVNRKPTAKDLGPDLEQFNRIDTLMITLGEDLYPFIVRNQPDTFYVECGKSVEVFSIITNDGRHKFIYKKTEILTDTEFNNILSSTNLHSHEKND